MKNVLVRSTESYYIDIITNDLPTCKTTKYQEVGVKYLPCMANSNKPELMTLDHD